MLAALFLCGARCRNLVGRDVIEDERDPVFAAAVDYAVTEQMYTVIDPHDYGGRDGLKIGDEGLSVEDYICKYYYTTNQKPSKIDCYICRK